MIANTKAFNFAVKAIVSKLSKNESIKPLTSLVNQFQGSDYISV